jgi:murein DD-endopeptidase MepM/ murein hydrolase activator NlpD
MRRGREGLPAFVLVLVAMSGFGLLVWWNARPSEVITPIIPTEQIPTEDAEAWQRILQAGFGSNSTPLPTIAIPTASFAPPTLPGGGDSGLTPIPPAQVADDLGPTLNAIVTATRPAPSPTVLLTPIPVTEQFVTRPPAEWQPPPLQPPISRDPLGRDHYWFLRPVDSNATNFALFSYPYGSDGPQDQNPWRVHHGIDMPNPIGQTVRAAGSGSIIWAGVAFQDSASYGNVVLIQHDFGYFGQPLFTLYAHLQAVLVSVGDLVNGGDPIGLVGNTGRVSGPHVHFEVRLGENKYRATVNPLLWMVPYVAHGVIAGRVTGPRGELLQDHNVTIRDRRTGLVVQSTTTYIYLDNGSDVNADPLWQENFVVGDIPVGRYEVVTTIDGQRVSRIVDVLEGMTSFVDLALQEAATPIPPTPTP